MSTKTVSLAMTGASGAAYGLRLLETLLGAGIEVQLMVSPPGQIVIAQETDLRLPGEPAAMANYLGTRYGAADGQLRVFGPNQWFAPPASGSSAPRAMVVCPCTSGTLAAIANGHSDNLMERAADVVLKEHGRLILVLREMPLSAIHLEHMLKLARLGTVVMPACPGFYQRPARIEDLVDFVVARILDHLEVPHQLSTRWMDDGSG